MDALKWVELGIQFFILVGAVLIIRKDNSKLDKKMDDIAKYVTDIRLALKDCVTWEELARELGPLRLKAEDHEKRIGTIEVTCQQQHKGD